MSILFKIKNILVIDDESTVRALLKEIIMDMNYGFFEAARAEKGLKILEKEEISLIMSSIFKWKDAWRSSDIDAYLAFYSKDFKRADKSGFALFSEQKKSIFAKNEQKTIKLTNIDVSPYPNSIGKNMFKVLMDEEYLSPAVKFTGKKELFLEIADNQIKILSED